MDIDNFVINEDFSYNMTPQSKREVRRIISEHFDYIVGEWNKFFGNTFKK